MPIERDWLDYATGVGGAITPLLVLFLTGVGWHIKTKLEANRLNDSNARERVKELEDKLREDRIQTYNALLEPFFVLLTTDAVFASDPKYKGKGKDQQSIGKMLTLEYRKVGYKLSLIADDRVVRAYNKLMQFFFQSGHETLSQEELEIRTSQWIFLLSDLLLEIRRSMGNPVTLLNRWEMVESFITDVTKMKVMSDANPLS